MMKLPPEIERINNSLIDSFGIDTVTGIPIFRVSWSDDQYEKRHGTFADHSEHGIFIREVTETREVLKYSWVKARFILERLVLVPIVNMKDLPDVNLSYELLWIFETNNGLDALPPTQPVCEFIIKNVLEAQAIHKMMITGGEKIDRQMLRYSDPENTQEKQIEAKKARVESLVEELYGDESSLMGTSFGSSGSASFVPHNFEKGH